MHDVIEQLRKYSDAVADRVPAVSADSVTDRPSRRRYQRMLAAAAVVVVLALVVGVVVTRDGGTRRRPASSVPKPSKVTTIEPRNNTEGIDLIEPPPLGPRGDIATAFTGTELVAWGGDLEASNMGLPGPDRTYADGAAYNLAILDKFYLMDDASAQGWFKSYWALSHDDPDSLRSAFSRGAGHPAAARGN